MKGRFFLLIQLAWRALKACPGLSLLNILGVGIGISVILAIQTGNESALAAFQSTLDVVTGKANLEISGDGSPFDEKIFKTIQSMDGIAHASPLVEAVVMLSDYPGEYLRITGMDVFLHKPFLSFDFFSKNPETGFQALSSSKINRLSDWLTDPAGIVVTKDLAKKLNLHPESSLKILVNGIPKTLIVKNWISFHPDYKQADEHIAVMDIAAAQELLGLIGQLHRMDILTSKKPDEIISKLESILPTNVLARLPGRRGTQIVNMLNGFQLNLFAMSMIALLVAGFLLHATMTTFVVRQHKTLGILRSMGFTPRELQSFILIQASLIGIVGMGIGTGIGLLLARWSLDSMDHAISALYLLAHTQHLHVSFQTILEIWFFGICTVLAAAWRPSVEASQSSPVASISLVSNTWQSGSKSRHYLFACLFLLFTGLASYGALNTSFHWFGFMAALTWILAITCCIPLWTLKLSSLFARWLIFFSTSIIAELGFKNLSRSLNRSAITIAACMVAFSMMIGTSIMIDSFRSTVSYWMNETVRADVYLTPASNLTLKNKSAIPPKLVQEILKLPGISDFDTYHEIWVEAPGSEKTSDSRKIKLSSIDFGVLERHKHLKFKGPHPDHFMSLRDSKSVLINESFATHYHQATGDSILLRTPSGKVSFEIGGVFYDYSTDSGLILMDRSCYARLWNDPGVYSLALYLDSIRKPSEIKTEIGKLVGIENHLAVFSNQDLRSQVLRIFDQTFSITLGLRTITVVVAALGVFLTLTTLIAERSRELSILRAVGMSNWHVMRMILAEAFSLGWMGWILGCIGGIGLSCILACVINHAYFGWTVQWRLDPSLLIIAFFLAIPTSLLAGFTAGLRAIKMPMIESLRYE